MHSEAISSNGMYKELVKEGRVFQAVRFGLSPNTAIYKDRIRFVCISDTHNKLASISTKIPPGDVLIHAGDFTGAGSLVEVRQFNEALSRLPHQYKIVIAGNHELSFDKIKYEHDYGCDYNKECQKLPVSNPRQLLTNCIYLEDSETEVYGYRVYGSPWQPVYGGMAFNLKRGAQLLEKWNMVPDGIDLLVTHGPPMGHGDLPRDHTLKEPSTKSNEFTYA